MRLKVWEPYRSFRPFQRNVGRFFNEFELGLEPTEGLDDTTWTPKVDIYETDSSYVLSAELPGLTKEQINIDVNDNTLTIF